MRTLERAAGLWKTARFELFLMRKNLYQLFRPNNSHQKTILFILGCQRSGTTLMLKIFEGNLDARVYGESSELSSCDPRKLRLNPLASVKEVIEKDRVPLIVLKPLVETQNALKLLSFFKGSKALWMYRHYRDVALSNLRLFGIENGIEDLRPIVKNDARNWRAENVPSSVRQVVLEHFSEDMNPYDAAALFWFVRNTLLFEQKLDENRNAMMCRYEDLVTDPFETMNRIYEFIGHRLSGQRYISEVHPSSLRKGREIQLSPEIDILCKELLERLDKAYQKQSTVRN